jgi:hypothetical protein
MSGRKQRLTVIRGPLGILLSIALTIAAVKCADETPSRGLRQDGRVSKGTRGAGATHPSGSQGGHSGAPAPVVNMMCQECGDPPPPPPPPPPQVTPGGQGGCKTPQPCGAGGS